MGWGCCHGGLEEKVKREEREKRMIMKACFGRWDEREKMKEEI